MGLLSRLMSLIGANDEGRREDVDVTVERDPRADDAGTGADAGASEAGSAAESEPAADASEAVGDGTIDAADDAASEQPAGEAPPEAGVEERPDEDGDGAATGDDAAAAPDDGTEGPAAEAVDTVTGIGPAYSQRLAAAGVETVGDLAAADPDALADETDIGASRVVEWIERADARLQ